MNPLPYVRAMDPATGDVRHLDGGTWVAGSPGVEVVVRTLRTVKGSFQPDPELGVEYNLVDRVRPNAAATLVTVLEKALAFAVREGTIEDLTVRAAAGSQLRADVAFVDPRDPSGVRHTYPVIL